MIQAKYQGRSKVEYYEDAYEIGYEKIIDTYAAATQHVDQGLSLTLFFKDTATTRDVNKAQIYAWRDVNGTLVESIWHRKYVTLHALKPGDRVTVQYILEVREKARAALGGKFVLPAFHDAVLQTGSVPLDVLAEVINQWIASQR